MDFFGVDSADLLASRFLSGDDSPTAGDPDLVALSVRIPDEAKRAIDAISGQTGMSRNAVFVYLLDAGLKSFIRRLPDEAQTGFSLRFRSE